MTVRAILNRKGNDVVTIGPTETIAQAAALLAKHRIGAVPVGDTTGRIDGILSERDIVRLLTEGGSTVLSVQVHLIMTRTVFICSEKNTVTYVMEKMTSGKYRHMPVVDGGLLVGIISIGDVVKHRIEQIEHEAKKMREYISNA